MENGASPVREQILTYRVKIGLPQNFQINKKSVDSLIESVPTNKVCILQRCGK
jgi:hypothetical protein